MSVTVRNNSFRDIYGLSSPTYLHTRQKHIKQMMHNIILQTIGPTKSNNQHCYIQ